MEPVISIPHAVEYDHRVHRNGYLLPDEVLNRHVDRFSDRIFRVPGIPTVEASGPRWLGDVNRHRYDFSELGVLPWMHPHGMRARASIHANPEELLSRNWDSFHGELERLLRPGRLLLDGHTMDKEGNYQGQDSGRGQTSA